MKICPRCGYQNPPNAFFCEKCHYPLFQIRETNVILEERKETVEQENKKTKIDITVFEYLYILYNLYNRLQPLPIFPNLYGSFECFGYYLSFSCYRQGKSKLVLLFS